LGGEKGKKSVGFLSEMHRLGREKKRSRGVTWKKKKKDRKGLVFYRKKKGKDHIATSPTAKKKKYSREGKRSKEKGGGDTTCAATGKNLEEGEDYH